MADRGNYFPEFEAIPTLSVPCPPPCPQTDWSTLSGAPCPRTLSMVASTAPHKKNVEKVNHFQQKCTFPTCSPSHSCSPVQGRNIKNANHFNKN